MTDFSIAYRGHTVTAVPYADIIAGELIRGTRFVVSEHHTKHCEFESRTYLSPLYARAEVDRCCLVKAGESAPEPPRSSRTIILTDDEQDAVTRLETERMRA